MASCVGRENGFECLGFHDVGILNRGDRMLCICMVLGEDVSPRKTVYVAKK